MLATRFTLADGSQIALSNGTSSQTVNISDSSGQGRITFRNRSPNLWVSEHELQSWPNVASLETFLYNRGFSREGSSSLPVPQEADDIRREDQGNVVVIHCDTWQAFKSDRISALYREEQAIEKSYLFRGQRSAEWPLISSFDRWYSQQHNRSRHDKAKLAAEFIRAFRTLSEGQPIPELVWESEELTLAVAQHYGVLTRLLDWTESPYVAAFFAFQGALRENTMSEKVAVWCLDRHSAIWSGEYGAEVIEVRSFGNERLRNQRGRFTRLKATFDSLEEYVDSLPDATGALTKYLIPKSEARTALADLDLMGINPAIIYPGVDGCAQTANLRMTIKLLQN